MEERTGNYGEGKIFFGEGISRDEEGKKIFEEGKMEVEETSLIFSLLPSWNLKANPKAQSPIGSHLGTKIIFEGIVSFYEVAVATQGRHQADLRGNMQLQTGTRCQIWAETRLLA